MNLADAQGFRPARGLPPGQGARIGGKIFPGIMATFPLFQRGFGGIVAGGLAAGLLVACASDRLECDRVERVCEYGCTLVCDGWGFCYEACGPVCGDVCVRGGSPPRGARDAGVTDGGPPKGEVAS